MRQPNKIILLHCSPLTLFTLHRNVKAIAPNPSNPSLFQNDYFFILFRFRTKLDDVADDVADDVTDDVADDSA